MQPELKELQRHKKEKQGGRSWKKLRSELKSTKKCNTQERNKQGKWNYV